MEKNKPEQKFRAGAISATVWKNKGNSAGKVTEFFTIKLERRYKDSNDQWQGTDSLGINDIPKAILVLQKAFEHIITKKKTDTESE
jgi:hypothetical protein